MKYYAVTTNNDVSRGEREERGLGASSAVTFRGKQLRILAPLRFYAA
jgi:hypothetical protein